MGIMNKWDKEGKSAFNKDKQKREYECDWCNAKFIKFVGYRVDKPKGHPSIQIQCPNKKCGMFIKTN